MRYVQTLHHLWKGPERCPFWCPWGSLDPIPHECRGTVVSFMGHVACFPLDDFQSFGSVQAPCARSLSGTRRSPGEAASHTGRTPPCKTRKEDTCVCEDVGNLEPCALVGMGCGGWCGGSLKTVKIELAHDPEPPLRYTSKGTENGVVKECRDTHVDPSVHWWMTGSAKCVYDTHVHTRTHGVSVTSQTGRSRHRLQRGQTLRHKPVTKGQTLPGPLTRYLASRKGVTRRWGTGVRSCSVSGSEFYLGTTRKRW